MAASVKCRIREPWRCISGTDIVLFQIFDLKPCPLIHPCDNRLFFLIAGKQDAYLEFVFGDRVTGVQNCLANAVIWRRILVVHTHDNNFVALGVIFRPPNCHRCTRRKYLSQQERQARGRMLCSLREQA